MQGYEWPEKRNNKETGYIRAIRNQLTSNLSILLPTLQRTIAVEFDYQLQQCTKFHGKRGLRRYISCAEFRQTFASFGSSLRSNR